MVKKHPYKYPQKISGIVDKLLKHWEKKKQSHTLLLNSLWKEIVGEKISQHAHPEGVIGKKLLIRVESASWMNELTFLKEKITIEIKKRLAEQGIVLEDVHFKLG